VPDFKAIAEVITGIAAIIAAIKAALAHGESKKTREETGIIRTEIRSVLHQTQTISQNLAHVQQTNVNVFTSGQGVESGAPIFLQAAPQGGVGDRPKEQQD